MTDCPFCGQKAEWVEVTGNSYSSTGPAGSVWYCSNCETEFTDTALNWGEKTA